MKTSGILTVICHAGNLKNSKIHIGPDTFPLQFSGYVTPYFTLSGSILHMPFLSFQPIQDIVEP